MPYAVQDLLRNYPGLSGLLVSAVLSGSLSTLSSGYNALAAVTWDDFVRPRVSVSEVAALRLTKLMAAAYGFLSISIAFLVGSMESIIQAASSLVGALSGPLLAIFTLGIFFPCCRKKGAITGCLAALATSWWLSLGSIMHPREADDLPTSTAGCVDFNQTITAGSFDPRPIPSGINRFYHISFIWIGTVGFTTHMVVSLVISLIFERNEKEEVNPKYICPFVRRYMRNYVKKLSTENVRKEPLITSFVGLRWVDFFSLKSFTKSIVQKSSITGVKESSVDRSFTNGTQTADARESVKMNGRLLNASAFVTRLSASIENNEHLFIRLLYDEQDAER
ncbi:hypothetical protein HPB51_001716 [Rhipicephalus microplus]|uniref:Sodium-coupled monocarboxylate transporter 2 n=1 Tax=Rhipicephalus microplus TaxID=6941 RepID=A0A9J6DEK8_RHIMP|nr:hypothetical protein HPB51_001716 [Rhipicephalus microplus]